MSSTSIPIPDHFRGLVDDAAIFPPGNASLVDAVADHLARRDTEVGAFVGPLVVTDLRLPDLVDLLAEHDPVAPLPVAVVVTGGASALEGAQRWATGTGLLELRGLEIPVPAGADARTSVQRIVTAAATVEAPLAVELPHTHGAPTNSWLEALDEIAAAGHRVKFRTGGVTRELFPPSADVAAWINAALDREVAFKCTAGLHNALRHRDAEHGFEHQGFLNVLVATRAAWDGVEPDLVVSILEETDSAAIAAEATALGPEGIAETRRWFTSFGSCDVLEPLDDLVALGLIGADR